MAYVDQVFVSMCKDILENGTDTQGEAVRPTWPDTGEKAYTIKKFGVCNKYDLRKEFPLLTLRPTALRLALDEILWIYQKKSNKVADLKSSIWKEWEQEDGTIGKAYGYQVGEKYIHHVISKEEGEAIPNTIRRQYPSFFMEHIIPEDRSLWAIQMDQIDSVIWDLKHNPYSRRIMTNLYNFKDLHRMALYPCAYSMTFNVTKDKDSDKLVLNLLLNQRSQDILAANNWNVVQYSGMLMMIAQACDMIPGEFVHMIADCHIYDRHVPIIKELIERPQYPAPKVILNPEVKNFYDFKPEDFVVEDYQHGEQIKNIPIAV